MKKITTLLMAITLILSLGAVSAQAAGYTFDGKDSDDFYRSTQYEDVHGSEYNYGGQNVTDFYDTSLLPGLISPTPQTSGSAASGAYGIYDAAYGNYDTGYSSDFTSDTPAFTSVSDLKRADGSIGTLYIPSLSITMKAYEGTGSGSMAKGAGHFTDTSGWNGNIGLCGHNRGATYTIGSIKNLKAGDTIQYTTVLGTRTYSVSFVGTISNTDWSYLSATADNRITLITCLAGQPALRVCVQAVETQ